MKRVVVLVVLFTWLGVTPAFAAGPDAQSPAAAPPAAAATPRYDFSARSAGIDQMVKATTRPDVRRAAPAAAQATGNKSFWKTPWPYVIGGGVVAALVVISQTKEGGLY
jgi:hypothetical protein